MQEKINSIVDTTDVKAFLIEYLVPMQAQLATAQQTIKAQQQVIDSFGKEVKELSTIMKELASNIERIKSKINLLRVQSKDSVELSTDHCTQRRTRIRWGRAVAVLLQATTQIRGNTL